MDTDEIFDIHDNHLATKLECSRDENIVTTMIIDTHNKTMRKLSYMETKLQNINDNIKNIKIPKNPEYVPQAATCPPPMFDNSHYRRKLNGEQESVSGDNGWNQDNTKTIREWQANLELSSFVYNDVSTKYDKYLQKIVILTIILGSITTFVTGLASVLVIIDNKWLIFGLTIFGFLMILVTTIVTGIGDNQNWKDKSKLYAQYSEKLNALWFTFETEMNFPEEHRIQASDFIKRMSGQYLNIMKESPDMDNSENIQAIHRYRNHIFDDIAWNKKFNKRLVEELV